MAVPPPIITQCAQKLRIASYQRKSPPPNQAVGHIIEIACLFATFNHFSFSKASSHRRLINSCPASVGCTPSANQ